jgi:hypothetical protein
MRFKIRGIPVISLKQFAKEISMQDMGPQIGSYVRGVGINNHEFLNAFPSEEATAYRMITKEVLEFRTLGHPKRATYDFFKPLIIDEMNEKSRRYEPTEHAVYEACNDLLCTHDINNDELRIVRIAPRQYVLASPKYFHTVVAFDSYRDQDGHLIGIIKGNVLNTRPEVAMPHFSVSRSAFADLTSTLRSVYRFSSSWPF